MKRLFQLAVLLLASASAHAAAPVLFFSDITSGPKTGGENNKGAFGCVYGVGFGATRGTSHITIGVADVDNYPVWGATYLWYQKSCFQLGSAVTGGNMIMTTSEGVSNALPFTVRSGNVYFVATTGNDLNDGSFATPWLTLPKARTVVTSGDFVYAMNGVTQTTMDDFGSCLWLGDIDSNDPDNPVAFLAYPGASVIIGNATGCPTPNPLDPKGAIAVRGFPHNGDNNDFVISGFTLIAAQEAIGLTSVSDWRMVGNDMSCPNAQGQDGCHEAADGSSNLFFAGNHVHNVGDTAGSISKVLHGVYFTSDTVVVEVAWNLINPNPTHSTTSGSCRGVQFFSTGGSDQYVLSVHDNKIKNTICDAINFATITGPDNLAYNNELANVGTGPDPTDGASNYSCFLIAGGGTDPVNIFNNTCYNAGNGAGSDTGAITLGGPPLGGPPVVATNNIFDQANGQPYITASSTTHLGNLTGNHNLWFGAGAAPVQTSNNVSADPEFIDAPTGNFHLQATSPAINGGTTLTTASPDLDGIPRPQNTTYALGAYERAGTPPPVITKSFRAHH